MTQLADDIGRKLTERDRPVLDLFGIRVERVEPGKSRLTLKVQDNMVNAHRYCHGGIVYSLADTAFAYASQSDNGASVTLSADIFYVQPAMIGDELRAEAQVITRASHTGTCDVEVTNQRGEPVVRFRGIYYRWGGSVLKR